MNKPFDFDYDDGSVNLDSPMIQLQPEELSQPGPGASPAGMAAGEADSAGATTDGNRLAAAYAAAIRRPEPVDIESLLRTAVEDAKVAANCAPFLPLLFRVRPDLLFSLHESLPFAPFYDRHFPPQFLLKTATGCGKSTNLAFKAILIAASNPGLRVMFVTPLQVHCRRFARNYVGAAIENSFIRNLITSPRCRDNAQLRELANGSVLLYSHAFQDCERARHTPCDILCFDELEAINVEFLPLLAENLSASQLGRLIYAGTGRTFDDAVHDLWGQSSQGEWVIRCRSCGKENMPLADEDLFNMLGPKGLVCAKCGYSLDSMADGRYVHRFPDRLAEFPGLHIGQPILPLFNRNPQRWQALLKKAKIWPKTRFCNLVGGEERDCGVRLIPEESIRKASALPFHNDLVQARAYASDAKYIKRSLGIDWRGARQAFDAATAMAVVGLRNDGRSDVLYAAKMDQAAGLEEELAMARQLHREFECTDLGHGLRGAGESRHMPLVQLGLGRPSGWVLETTNGRFFAKEHRNPAGIDYTRLNRAAGIQLLAHEISNSRLLLPRWREDLSQNWLLDLSSWYMNMIEHANGHSTLQILRSARQPESVGLATLYATCTNWRVANSWPEHMRELAPEGIVLATQEKTAAVATTAM